jgi:peptidoglycan/xylan/chitin deacetylase (PgdA/CDA1 family)
VLIAKRAIKRAAGLASVLLRPAARPAPWPSTCVLVYHRVTSAQVAERQLDDWNVTPAAFERQVAALAETSEFIFVSELRGRLAQAQPSKPLICLTFDDGYQNFHDDVLPILRRYNAKATTFVVSGYVESEAPMPFDKWGVRHSSDTPAGAWRAMTWCDLEACAKSGLVEIGGHSHRHANAAVAPTAEVIEEPERCRQVLCQRLGDGHARAYAYPYGSSRLGQVTGAYVDAVRNAGFECAVTTDLGLASRESDHYRYPRVEVYRSDGPAVVQAKAGGSLAPFFVTDQLRRAKR